jgi:pyridoxamine 5'-phosphate oxidase
MAAAPPSRLESLSAIEAAVWRELEAAPHDKPHPWRTPVLATTDGDVGDARTMVLRDLRAAERQLLMFTDSRSFKAAQIAAHPLGTLVMWSEALGWQLRLRVRLWLETDGLAASSYWTRLKLSPAAHDYLSALAPGSVIDGAQGPRGDRAHFALLGASVLSIDWLELHELGHRRARFEPDAAPCWLQP